MDSLIKASNLSKHFYFKNGKLFKAVNNVSLEIFKGETLGLVGESGSGKSTLGRMITGIYEPDSGSVLYKDKKILDMKRKELAKVSQTIFQNPYASLNPRMTVAEIVAEGLKLHFKMSKSEIENKVIGLLRKVGLHSEHASRFPHEFSGGQRQRIGIARALAISPEFIVCDEPISALDVSVQSQIVNLLKKLQKEENLTYLFISHDLSMVRYISDRIAVMLKGKIVELGPSDEVCFNPIHPYTKSLLNAVPKVDFKNSKLDVEDIDLSEISKGKQKLVEVKKGHFVSEHFA